MADASIADEESVQNSLNAFDTISEDSMTNESRSKESQPEENEDMQNNGLVNEIQEQEQNPGTVQPDDQSSEQSNENNFQNDQSGEVPHEEKTQMEEQFDEKQPQEVLGDEAKRDEEQLQQNDETQLSHAQTPREQSAVLLDEPKSPDYPHNEPLEGTQSKDKVQSQDIAEGPTPPQRDEKSGLEPPAWMTLELFQEALSAPTEGKREHLTVIGMQVKPAVGKGDNYSSTLYKVRLEVLEEATTGQRSPSYRYLIVKSEPEGEVLRALIQESKAFSKENRMYQKTLPRMHELIKEKMRNELPTQRLAPRAFISPSGQLIFEDLGDQGFKMANRQNGMDLQHCLLAMRALAVFHALSMQLHEEDPELTNYEESLYMEKSYNNLRLFTANSYETLHKIIKKWIGYQKYAIKIRDLGKVIFDQFIQIKDQTEERFKVLNHGDFWLNNMMFKYSYTTGEPIDIRIIDHQISRYTSLCFDLHYFIFSSPCPDIRTDKMDAMISAYHSTLGKTLVRLGLTHRMMSRQDLDRELQRTAIFGILTACSILPVVLADPSDAIELDKLTPDEIEKGNANIFSGAMSGKKFASAMKLLLPYWEQKGLI